MGNGQLAFRKRATVLAFTATPCIRQVTEAKLKAAGKSLESSRACSLCSLEALSDCVWFKPVLAFRADANQKVAQDPTVMINSQTKIS